MTNFVKMNGLGNDFVIIDKRRESFEIDSRKAHIIAYRRFGIGCDQVITLEPSNNADVFMRIYNSDGSESGACGNATRCVANILMEETGRNEASVETRTGVLHGRKAGLNEVTVNMGEPTFDWQKIPLREDSDVLGLPIEVGPLKNPVAVGMGNPHMVFFVDDVSKLRLRQYGPELEVNPLYPQRANVSIVQVVNRGYLKTKVWERGVGKTLACGTAACASAVAAITLEKTEPSVVVEQPGGTMKIDWLESGEVLMTGKVAVSFRGAFDEQELFGKK